MAESNATRPLGLGLIGCGDFGEFCMETYSRLAGLVPAGVVDTRADAARRVGERFGVPALATPEELFARDDVDIVHIATPPSSHHALGLAAARAGKHVLCEKPLAVTMQQAGEILAAAEEADVLMTVNFVLRYNEVTRRTKAIIDSGLMGRPIHASFENFAGDEKLGPNHWFWDKSISGGIFIEHAVHFFDLYTHWFGPGEIASAHALTRENSSAEDRVMCLVGHDSGLTANHYHGFDQAHRLDRQNHHILFETGDMHVHGWVPERIELLAVTDQAGAERLVQLCPGATVETVETYPADKHVYHSRWIERSGDRKVRLHWRPEESKDALYRRGVGELMADQVRWIRDRSHAREITEANGRDSLALAVRAAELAGG